MAGSNEEARPGEKERDVMGDSHAGYASLIDLIGLFVLIPRELLLTSRRSVGTLQCLA